MGKIKRFLSTALTYFFGSALSKLILLFLLPLYTSYLSPEEFGTYDLIVTIVSFIAPLAFFQIWDSMFRFSFDKDELKNKHVVISNAFMVWCIGFFIYCIFFFVFYIVLKFDFQWVIFFYGLFISLQYQYTFIARVFLENRLFVTTGVYNTIFAATLNFILIVYFNMGVAGLFLGNIFGLLIQIVLIEYKLKILKSIKIKYFDKKLQLEMVRFAIPLCLASLTYWLLSGYTKVVITKDLGMAANGLYAVATKFTMILSLIVSVFQFAWNEMAYLMVGEKDKKLNYQTSLEFLGKILILSSAVFILLIKLIYPYFITNENYYEAIWLIPLALISVIANAYASFIGTIFLAEKTTKTIYRTTLIAAIVNIILVGVFTPLWGINGAVISLGAAFVILTIIRLYAIKRDYNITLNKSLVSDLLILVTSFIVFYNLDNEWFIIISILVYISLLIFRLRKQLGLLFYALKK